MTLILLELLLELQGVSRACFLAPLSMGIRYSSSIGHFFGNKSQYCCEDKLGSTTMAPEQRQAGRGCRGGASWT
jgi:hypothetical protein